MSVYIGSVTRDRGGNVSPGIAAYVLAQGDPTRADGVDGNNPTAVSAFLAGETILEVFSDPDLVTRVNPTLTTALVTDVDGRLPYYIAEGAGDVYQPSDASHPITPVGNTDLNLAVVSEAPLRPDYPEFASASCPLGAMMTALNVAPPGAKRYEGYIQGRHTIPPGQTIPTITQDNVSIWGDGTGSAHVRIDAANTTQANGLAVTGSQFTCHHIRFQNLNSTVAGYTFVIDGATDSFFHHIMTSGFAGLVKTGSSSSTSRWSLREVTGSWEASFGLPVIHLIASINGKISNVNMNGQLTGSQYTVPAALMKISPVQGDVFDAGFYNAITLQCSNSAASAVPTGYWYGLWMESIAGVGGSGVESTIVNQHFADCTFDHQTSAGVVVISGGRYFHHNWFGGLRLTNDVGGTGANGSGIILAQNASDDFSDVDFEGGAAIVTGDSFFFATQGDTIYQLNVRGTANTYKIRYSGNDTATIAPGATAASIEAALDAVSGIGTHDVRVLGGPGATGGREVAYQIILTGALGSANQTLSIQSDTLSGGTTPGATLTKLATGRADAGRSGAITCSAPFYDVRGSATKRRAMASLGMAGVAVTSPTFDDGTTHSEYYAETLKDIGNYRIAPETITPAPNTGFIRHFAYAAIDATRQVESYTGHAEGVPRQLYRNHGRATTAAASGTAYLIMSGQTDLVSNALGATATGANTLPADFYWDQPTHKASGLDTRLKIEGVVEAAGAPSLTVTFGLYPVTISGGNYILGTVVSGSTVAVVGAAQTSVHNEVGYNANSLATGMYTVGYTLSATPGANVGLTGTVSVLNNT